MFSLPSTSWLFNISNDLEMITYSIPCAVCLAMSSSCRTSNLLSVTWIWRYKVEPSHHWVTIASSGLAMQPINKRIFTWRVFLRRKTKCEIMGRVVIFFLFLCYSFRPRSFSFDTRLIFPELPGDRQSQKWPTQRQHTPPRESLETHVYICSCLRYACFWKPRPVPSKTIKLTEPREKPNCKQSFLFYKHTTETYKIH